MNRLLMCAILLASLAACAAPSRPGAFRCDEQEKACVRLTVAEPIKSGEPVSVTITVNSEKDISGLKVFLAAYPPGKVPIVEAPGLPSPKGSTVNWTTDVQAKHTLTFMREMQMPSMEGENGGYAQIELHADIQDGGVIVSTYLTIFLTSKGGQVYFARTPIPIPGWTPGQPALAISPTPGTSPTFIPTPNPGLSPKLIPTPT